MDAEFGEFGDVPRLERGLALLPGGYRFFVRANRQTHRHDVLVGDRAGLHGAGLLVDDEGIWRDQTSHNRLTQTPCRIDHDLIACARNWISGEEDTRCVRRHELLHNDSKRDLVGANALTQAISEGSRRPQRRPTTLYSIEHLRRTPNVEVCFLLACERHPRQILRRGRRPYGDRRIILAQGFI